MGQISIPGYTLKRKLGQGGMAAVFLATQDSFGREVALKLLVPSLAKEADFAERFMREARTMAQLAHNHIIVVHDVGIAAGNLHYYAMAYHNGGDLTQRIRGGGVTVQEALRVTSQIADALSYAHEQGIVHRDIKPDNVLFRERDDSVVLTDFGIAKSLHNEQNQLTQAGSTVGTPKYMSPEQARGQKVDGRSDLYSLGCMLFEMLTGRTPFFAEEAVTLAIKHCQDPVPSLPSELARFQPLINRLLAKNPAERPQSGLELVVELDRLLKPQSSLTASFQAKPANVQRTAENSAATVMQSALMPTQASSAARTAAVTRRPYQAFFRTEETTSGNILSKRYGMKAEFSCDNYEEFKKQLSQLQEELRGWLEKRGKRAHSLHLAIEAHPWILGRVRELVIRSRKENSPLGQLLSQAEVTLHLYDEEDKTGQTLPLSVRNGKRIEAADLPG